MVRHVIVANEIDTSFTTHNDITAAYLGVFAVHPDGSEVIIDSSHDDYKICPQLCFVRGKSATDSANKVVYLSGIDVIGWRSVAVTAGTKKVVTVGYQGSGTENIPVNRYDATEYMLQVINLSEPTSLHPAKSYSISSNGNDSTAAHGRYNIGKKQVKAVYDNPDSIVIAKLTNNETTIATAADVVATNGSATVTTADTSAGAVGDFLVIGYDTFKIIAETASTSWTLDRPFCGTTGTYTYNATRGATTVGYIAAATIDDATLFGIEFTAKTVNQNFEVSIDTLSGYDGGEYVATTTEMVYSHGLYADVLADEKSVEAWEGAQQQDRFSNIIRYADSSKTYDCYEIDFMKEVEGHDGIHGTHKMKQTIRFWFDQAAATNVASYFGDNSTPGLVENWLKTTPGTGNFEANI